MPEQSPYVLLKAAEDSAAAKLWEHGTRVLSTTELIALIIGDVRGVDGEQKAREMLKRAEGESALAACDAATPQSAYGLGRRQAERVAAAFELGRRAQMKMFDPSMRIRQPKDVADRYIPALRDPLHPSQ
jgi:DNA repair protein RadC